MKQTSRHAPLSESGAARALVNTFAQVLKEPPTLRGATAQGSSAFSIACPLRSDATHRMNNP
jgi:hypothetical protein